MKKENIQLSYENSDATIQMVIFNLFFK